MSAIYMVGLLVAEVFVLAGRISSPSPSLRCVRVGVTSRGVKENDN